MLYSTDVLLFDRYLGQVLENLSDMDHTYPGLAVRVLYWN